MDLSGLLAELERTTDQERARLMVAYGRRSRPDPELADMLRQLGQGTFYERRLALTASALLR
jgi:hypothetical protein